MAETNCKCIDHLNSHLAEHNTKLDVMFQFGSGQASPVIAVSKIEKRGKKPVTIAPTFCPFCGHKYKWK